MSKEPNSENKESNSNDLEHALKHILQLCVEQIKPKLRTKSLLTQLQELMSDYSTLDQLANIIIKVLEYGIAHPFSANISRELQKDVWEEEAYLTLESSLQKHEQKIRNCIRNQQQTKLYCQQLQTKIKQLQEAKHEVVVSTKKTILQLKRDNQQLIEKVKQMQLTHQNQKIQNSNLHPITPKKGKTIQSASNLSNNNVAHARQHSSTKDKFNNRQQLRSNRESSQSKDNSHSSSNIRVTLMGLNNRNIQNESKSKLKREGSKTKHNYHKVDAFKGKLEQVNNIISNIEDSKNMMRGSASSKKKQIVN